MFLLSVLVLAFISGCTASIPRPRGVAISMASHYRAGEPFRCLDGSKEIPFDYINDDYCDCPDGTDEPGTAACPGGKFHCTNAGYRPTNILSSRVNDGICDCCDGTDEWGGNIDCVNNCKELGKKMREDTDKKRQMEEQGYKTKLEYIAEGKKMREEKKVQLEQLQKSKAEQEVVKTEMEQKKNEAEAPEKEAKEKHEQKWKEELERIKAETERETAEKAFVELDTNADKKVDMAEIKVQSQFDIDSNGEVSEDEAKEHLEGEEEADLEQFTTRVWPNIKDFYKSAEQRAKEESENAEDPDKSRTNVEHSPQLPSKRDHSRLKTHASKRRPLPSNKGAASPDLPEDEYDDDDEEEEDDNRQQALPTKVKAGKPLIIMPTEDEAPPVPESNRIPDIPDKTGEDEEDDKMPDYDEGTQSLINVAEEARHSFNEAETKLKDTENQINALNSYLTIDYGPEEEFSALKGNCYEYTDREYIYKLCAFERASQRPKAGGSETTLGNWGRWEGSPEDKYAAQKYDNGLSCWNGPNRSVKVNFKCGLENQVTSAFEPSRCEYEFDFITPSKCTAPRTSHEDVHDEL